MHVSRHFFSLWNPANSLFVREEYVKPTWKRLHAGYVQKRKDVQKIYLTPQFAVNNRCSWFNGELVHTQDNYFDIIFYFQQ